MSLRVRLAWAFAIVVFLALLVAGAGLLSGILYSFREAMHGFPMHRMHPGPPWGDGMPFGPGGTPPTGTLNGPLFFFTVVRWTFISSLIALAAAAVTGYFTAGRTTRALRQLHDAVQRLDLRDLTQRVPVAGDREVQELASAFNGMADRLSAEERARRQLLADVAHELRHPLAVLQGRLELMQDGVVPLEQEALLPLQDGVIRLTRLVGDLRDLSLAEVGNLSLHMGSVDLRALLCDLQANLEPVAAARAITLTTDLAEGLSPVPADADRIRQVFVNLISNALQFTPAGGAVQVRGWQQDGGVVVEVADSGPGIAPEDVPHIFERFYRGEKSRSRATGGSGLGLAIVRSLVELHGGRIGVSSKLGEGSRFTVALPGVKTAAGD